MVSQAVIASAVPEESTVQGFVSSPGNITAQMVATLLESPGFARRWKRYHSSQGEKPLRDLATEFRACAHDFSDRPDLQVFAARLLHFTHCALGKPDARVEKRNLRSVANSLKRRLEITNDEEERKIEEFRTGLESLAYQIPNNAFVRIEKKSFLGRLKDDLVISVKAAPGTFYRAVQKKIKTAWLMGPEFISTAPDRAMSAFRVSILLARSMPSALRSSARDILRKVESFGEWSRKLGADVSRKTVRLTKFAGRAAQDKIKTAWLMGQKFISTAPDRAMSAFRVSILLARSMPSALRSSARDILRKVESFGEWSRKLGADISKRSVRAAKITGRTALILPGHVFRKTKKAFLAKARQVYNAVGVSAGTGSIVPLMSLWPSAPPRDKKPDEAVPVEDTMQKILAMVEKETGQKPFTPVRSSARFVKDMWTEIMEDAMKHKLSFAVLLTTSVSALRFMNARLGSSGTIYIEPENTSVTGFSMNAFLENRPVEKDATLQDISFQTCHDHLAPVIGDDAADAVLSASDAVGVNLFPEQCAQVKSLATNAQGILREGYNALNERLGWFTADRVRDISDLIPQSYFHDAFVAATKWMETKVYDFDTIENVVIHTLLTIGAAKLAHKLGSMENEEAQEAKDKIRDFFNRTVRNVPLSYAFGIAGTVYAYAEGGGFNSGMIWLGAGGALAGSIAHGVVRKFNRKKHVMEMMGPLGQNTSEISDADRAAQKEKLSRHKISRKWKGKLAGSFAVASAFSQLVKADASGVLDAISNTALRETLIVSSKVAGATLGGGLVAGSYGVVNVPQDVAFHIIFAMAGGIVGYSTAKFNKAVKIAADNVREAAEQAERGLQTSPEFSPGVA